MGYISDKTIQQIQDYAKIEEVVGDYVQLRKRGVNMIGLCPFHNEKTPSFNVSPVKNIFKCFGCGEGGNSIQFVMKVEQLSYVEALRQLAAKYNIEVEEIAQNSEQMEKQQEADSLYIVNAFAQEHFATNLFETDYGKSIGLTYFKSRGLLEDTIRKFGLGYADGSQSDLAMEAQKKGYQANLMQKAGLLNTSQKDFFRQRVMFPVHNLSGKVLGFGGRTLSEDKKQPKYLNTPESEIYLKSKILYGMHQAKKMMISEDNCLMVEGYMDVITLHQAGIEHVVASSGTSLTTGQLQLVQRFTSNITILYDGDAAGIKAALRGLDLVLEQDMNVRIVLIPDGDDPDSFLRKVGVQAFKDFIKKEAADFIHFKAKQLLKDASSDPIKKAQVIQELIQTISIIPDPFKRALYVKDCSLLMEVGEQILHNEINKKINQKLKKDKEKEQKEQIFTPEEEPSEEPALPDHQLPALTHQILEEDLARILIQFGHIPLDENDSVATFILNNMAEISQDIDTEILRVVTENYSKAIEANQKVVETSWLNHTNPVIAQFAVSVCSSPYIYSENWEKLNVYLNSQKMPAENHVADTKSAILRFKLKKIERLMQKNQIEIKEAQFKQDMEELTILIKLQMRLITLRGECAAQLNTVVLK